jgi:PadR family transcriptional regulator PadR
MAVPREPNTHPQTIAVLRALAEDPTAWHYGYGLARQTGLRSGTLYPILLRLAEQGYLEAVWELDPPEGRPRRHQYRLTASGLALAARVASTPAPRAAARRPALGGAG